MSYSWIYYGRKARRVALFSIKLIDFFLLYLAFGKQLYLSIKLFLLFTLCWGIGSGISLIRRKIKHGDIKDRPKSEAYLHPNHDRRENIMLLGCIGLLVAELAIVSLPVPL
jgi:hypothetical protein